MLTTALTLLAKYWKPLALGLVLIAVYFAGVNYANNTCEREKSDLVRKYTQLIQDEVDRRQQVSEDYEKQLAQLKADVRTITETVQVEIVKPIYKECRVPESGIKLLNESINKLNQLRTIK